MPFLPNPPGQDTQAFVNPWGKISKNGLYIYYHHCTPVGLCGTTAMQPNKWETTSEPLAGGSVVNGRKKKISYAQNFLWEKTKDSMQNESI